MRTHRQEVESIVSAQGIIARRDHRELGTAIAWMLRRAELMPLLPGFYCAPGHPDLHALRLRALSAWDPDAVLVGRSAAQLSFWPELRAPVVECALKWDRPQQPGFAFVRRVVPPDLVLEQDGSRLTTPAATALDLCAQEGGDGIDRVLRARAATLTQLRAALALTPARAGNGVRRALLLESRDEAWSAAERLAHRLLREAGITGWKANRPETVDGKLYYIDVAFRQLRVAVEIDGRIHEDDADLFESDRMRQNALVLDGWLVLRFTWQMLQDHPEQVVAAIRQALLAAEARARPHYGAPVGRRRAS